MKKLQNNLKTTSGTLTETQIQNMLVIAVFFIATFLSLITLSTLVAVAELIRMFVLITLTLPIFWFVLFIVLVSTCYSNDRLSISFLYKKLYFEETLIKEVYTIAIKSIGISIVFATILFSVAIGSALLISDDSSGIKSILLSFLVLCLIIIMLEIVKIILKRFKFSTSLT